MIEFKEGDVFYAFGHQWKVGDKISSLHGLKVIDHDDFLYLAESVDFELNEPREGWYIPKSELDTEEKYNKAVEVFGLFGFNLAQHDADDFKENGNFIFLDDEFEIDFFEIINGSYCKTKCTYAQLMAIGELKRKMDEREKDDRKSEFFNAMVEANPDLELNNSESTFNRIKMAELEKCKIDFEIEKNIKRNKSKQAYDILKDMGIEYDLVKQQWYKKQYI